MGRKNIPSRAFILAAGFGTRLRPYTDDCPKPMVKVARRSLIWRCLDKLRDIGVIEVVVNLHYMADVLAAHLSEYMQDHPNMNIHLSFEADILDTGGGIRNALHYFRGEPFYVIAGDALWEDENIPALEMLANHWDAQKMDIITLLQPVDKMYLTCGIGDYDLLDNGLARRSLDKTGAYMWSNIRINSSHIYDGQAANSFSFLPIMDLCEKNKRLYALEHDGSWHHISTPKDLENVDHYFCKQENK